MNRITKGDARDFYRKLKRKERISFGAVCIIWAIVFGALGLMAGCNSVEPTPQPKTETELQKEWRDIYKDVTIPHAPRSYASVRDIPFDSEVELFNYILDGTGITAFRIDPNNPEHQRRYRRHLEEPKDFFLVVEEDI